jgi:hypothetical protein
MENNNQELVEIESMEDVNKMIDLFANVGNVKILTGFNELDEFLKDGLPPSIVVEDFFGGAFLYGIK